MLLAWVEPDGRGCATYQGDGEPWLVRAGSVLEAATVAVGVERAVTQLAKGRKPGPLVLKLLGPEPVSVGDCPGQALLFGE